MLDAVLEFLTLYAVTFVILFFVGWRRGWFLETAVHGRTARGERTRRQTRKHEAPRRSPSAAPARSRVRDQRAPLDAPWEQDVRQSARSSAGSSAGWPSRTRDAQDFPVHPAVAAASRKAGVKAGQVSHPSHWAIDTIKARPGWLLFEVEDFLGPAADFASYTIPGGRRAEEIPLYRASAVRAIEKGDNVVAASRRKVIQAKWDQRRELRGTPRKAPAEQAKTSAPRNRPEPLKDRLAGAARARKPEGQSTS